MKTSLIQLTFLCLFCFASCTPASFLEVDYALPAKTVTEKNALVLQPDKNKGEIATTDFTVNTTIDLQVVRSVNSAQTGNLLIDFSGSSDLTDIQLNEEQTLEFIDTGGQTLLQTLSVIDYYAGEQYLQIEFGTGRSGEDGLQPAGQQSIIIEDVLIN
jgi:hypothetical protein